MSYRTSSVRIRVLLRFHLRQVTFQLDLYEFYPLQWSVPTSNISKIPRIREDNSKPVQTHLIFRSNCHNSSRITFQCSSSVILLEVDELYSTDTFKLQKAIVDSLKILYVGSCTKTHPDLPTFTFQLSNATCQIDLDVLYLIDAILD